MSLAVIKATKGRERPTISPEKGNELVGLLLLALGVFLAYQIGFVDGLFTGDFHWEPA